MQKTVIQKKFTIEFLQFFQKISQLYSRRDYECDRQERTPVQIHRFP